MSKRGFTVVEMLIVIAIIAALLSIMSVGLTRAAAISRATSCRANLRQLFIAAEGYRGIEGGYPAAVLYHAEEGSLRTQAWDFDHRGDGTIEPGPIWSYLDGSPDTFQCPDFRGDSTFGDDPATGYNYNTTYIGAEGRFPQLDAQGRILQGWEHCRMGVPAAAHRRTSTTVIFGDGGWAQGANKFMRAPMNTVEGDLGLVCSGSQAFRHHGCTNAVFLDGHCECREIACEGPYASQNQLDDLMDFPQNGFLSEDDTNYDPR